MKMILKRRKTLLMANLHIVRSARTIITKSFFSEKETVPTKICVYEDPINSGGNDYVNGYADILYSVCPKGHKHVVYKKERRK